MGVVDRPCIGPPAEMALWNRSIDAPCQLPPPLRFVDGQAVRVLRHYLQSNQRSAA